MLAVVPGDTPLRVRYHSSVTNVTTGIAGELPDAEMVFAFVSPLGTPLDPIEEALHRALRRHNYRVEITVHLSTLLSQISAPDSDERPEARQERLMDVGNRLRELHGADYLVLMAIAGINKDRDAENGVAMPRPRQAYVIRSLKHPDEVARLRHVYGKGFFLLGISAPRSLRLATLQAKNFPLDEAERLLEKDAAEDAAIGQQTRDTFHLADAFVTVDEQDPSRCEAQIGRIVDLLFSFPFHPPTKEEHAMFMAYAAALRSGDLSRQVGAVIANQAGDIVASGANDAPSPQGGTYRPPDVTADVKIDESAGLDYLRGFDSNERERNRILAAVITALVPDATQDPQNIGPTGRADLIRRYASALGDTGILDLTEFGRAVHAEMAALMSSARSGVSPVAGTLYCTTFPCHNCAKHIIASGLAEVVYVEPYPKSKAKDLHGDALHLRDEEPADDRKRVVFRSFEGVGARRFVDLFSLKLGNGRPVRRKQKDADGARVTWERGEDSKPRLPIDPRSYLVREEIYADVFRQKQARHEIVPADGSRTVKAEDPDA